jgi:proline iminopeptidase
MLTLYPAINPYRIEKLAVDDLHSLYIEECGNPDGIPVVFLHGGPGAGICDDNRRYFDPEEYRIILFDQRGCGKSEPYGELKHNNCAALIEDLEKIRVFCGVEKWLIFGGSWGSTLALLYSQAHPQRVTGLILRGVFLGRSEDIDWLYQSGASKIFPDYWQEFLHVVPEAERSNNLAAYFKMLHNGDDITRMAAAKAWAKWEASCSTLEPCKHIIDNYTKPHLAVSMAKIATNFFLQDPLLLKNRILANIGRLQGIPAVVIHGRYDLVCPLENSFTLTRNWDSAVLKIIRDAGHSGFEPATVDALIHATKDFVQILQG